MFFQDQSLKVGMYKKKQSVVNHGEAFHCKKYLSETEARRLTKVLNNETCFKNVMMYHYDRKKGEIVRKDIGRQSYWLGDYAQAIQSTSKTVVACGTEIKIPTAFATAYTFPPIVLDLKERIERDFDCTFNACLVAKYTDPRHKMSFHSDAGWSLGPDPYVASLNLGASRRIGLKAKKGFPKERVDLVLNHGDLLMMREGCNANYLHGVLADPKCSPSNFRINLTFRKYRYDEEEKRRPCIDFPLEEV
jgi:alkylated DNA repair dioxygenase AlkB